MPVGTLDDTRRTNRAMQQPECAYSVKIETAAGQTADVPIAFMTREQLESFLQFDFKKLVEGAGIKGARIHIERANTADYERVLGEIAACLRTRGVRRSL
jgi:hypothetical protein